MTIRKRTRKIRKIILAMPAAAAEIPVYPNNAATTEMINKNMANFNIVSPLPFFQ